MLLLLYAGFCFGQQETVQPQRIIDCHTAEVFPRAYFGIECRTYPNGIASAPGAGVTFSVTAGLTQRLNLGFGYGGDGIIGRAAPVFNPHVGALIKYRILEESYFFPGLAIGYDHQGFGGIDPAYNGYVYKSQGFFCSASKNYLLFTSLAVGLHAGINYSFEEYPMISWPNGYGGITIGFNESFSVAAEYDLALNQRDPNTSDTSYSNPFDGYLNVCVRWFVIKTLCLEVDVKDVLGNKIDAAGNRLGWGRELKLTYFGKFF